MDRARRYHLTTASLLSEDGAALQRRLRKDFLALVDAAQLLGQTKAQFQKTRISTGVMRCHHFSRKVLIQRVDLERAELIWQISDLRRLLLQLSIATLALPCAGENGTDDRGQDAWISRTPSVYISVIYRCLKIIESGRLKVISKTSRQSSYSPSKRDDF